LAGTGNGALKSKVETVVIVGGGTAGWITAALLVKVLGNAIRIRLVESEAIGTVGVGEATIPPIQTLNRALGLDEADFLRATQGTIKLGIEFVDWWREGSRYMHAFGAIGKDFPFASFHHFWTRGVLAGRTDSFWDYSVAYQAAVRNRFARLERLAAANLPGLAWAYHFDASLYAAYLRRYAERLGVERIEGIVRDAELDPVTGFVRTLRLDGGASLGGELFVDCSGFRGLLIEEKLHAGYEHWNRWLPCDRAVAVQCERTEPLVPYTRATALDAGWQWRIPLRHRTGNGIVFSSRHLDEEEAKRLLLSRLDAPARGEPRVLRFHTGRRIRQWHGNCVAVGLASGFLEPLESTSIHLIQSDAIRLIKHFPHAGIDPAAVDEYNRQARIEWEHVRDFIILHYHLNERTTGDLWRECRETEPPESLARRIELFRRTGRVFREQDELFTEVAWQQVMIGQGIRPQDYHPLVDALSPAQLDDLLDGLKRIVSDAVDSLPDHAAFLERCLSA
jgi:tryptophan halogenase